MNDFQMTFLANDRRDTLLAEAKRERLAHSADAPAARTRRPRPQRPSALRAGASLLIGRVVLF